MSTIIKHKEFVNHKVYETVVAGRPLKIEVGKMAELANAAAMVTYGETSVLVAVTASPRPRDGIDFFPLSVDFEEKLYAVGRIPGSFMRREGQPSLPAVLASRLIDRPIRPLFPTDLRNDVVVTCTVMSVDYDCSPEVTAMIGVSACLSYSDIPWNGPIGCMEVGYVDGQIVMNPTREQKHASQMDVTVAATMEKVVMIEAGAKEIPDEIMYEGIVKAHEEIRRQVEFINGIVAEIGKPKFEYQHASFNQELFDDIVANFMDEAKAAMDTDDKNVREQRWNAMIDHWHEKYLEEYPDMDQYLEEFTYKFQKKIVKAWLLEGHRVDGRAKNEIRPLAAEVGLLPRAHGSGLFTRGQTQVLGPGALALIFPNQVHSYTALEPGTGAVLVVCDLSYTGGYADTLLRSHPEDPFLSGEKLHPNVPYAIQELEREARLQRESPVFGPLIQLVLARALPEADSYYDWSWEEPVDPAALTDWGQMDELHQEAVAALAEQHIITGKADGSFGCADTLQRADGATLIVRALEKVDASRSGEEKTVTIRAVDSTTGQAILPDQTMELTVRLLFLENVDYEGVAAPYSAYWDPKQPGKARWCQVPKAKYYQIQLIRDHRAVGDQYSIYGDGYDFSSLITEDGEYWFQVRSVRKSTNEKSDWTKSEKLKVTGEPKQEEAAPGPGEEDTALPEAAGSWQQAADGIRWWWRNPNGSFPAGEWMKINGEWYYFDEEGYWEMKEAGQS